MRTGAAAAGSAVRTPLIVTAMNSQAFCADTATGADPRRRSGRRGTPRRSRCNGLEDWRSAPHETPGGMPARGRRRPGGVIPRILTSPMTMTCSTAMTTTAMRNRPRVTSIGEPSPGAECVREGVRRRD